MDVTSRNKRRRSSHGSGLARTKTSDRTFGTITSLERVESVLGHLGVVAVWLSLVLLSHALVGAEPIEPGSGKKNPAEPRCKYSVRDVAFVNVHGKPWQLQLVKPADLDPSQFEDWNETLETKLDRTNVGYIWFEPGSPEAEQALSNFNARNDKAGIQDGQASRLPVMLMRSRSGLEWPVRSKDDHSMAEQLDWIVHSPARRKILDQVVDALCVLVLVESKDEGENERARDLATQAMVQIERQMWMLEKPTDRAAALVTVAHDTSGDESWLLWSLGIEEINHPCVAIVYGQGRRLGEVLSGDALSHDEIVGRASICGRDCECDLNRDWLYGQQVIHSWSEERERGAESSLDFDPHSAFVVAEVAQILQRNGNGNSDGRSVDLGTGLRIHDLEPGARESRTEASSPQGQSTDSESEAAESIPVDDVAAPGDPNDATGSSVPWPILAVMAIALVGTIVFIWTRLS